MASIGTGSAPDKAPWHLWLVGTASLLWNLYPAIDYLMTRLHVASWTAKTPPQMLAAIDAFPLWVSAVWALGVWGSFFGALLLLFRRGLALWAFVASLAGLVLFNLYLPKAGIAMPAALLTVVLIVLLLEIFYSWWMKRAGVLR